MVTIEAVSKALQEANRNYRGNQFNLHAYWRHLAAAAVQVFTDRERDAEVNNTKICSRPEGA